MWIVFLFRLGLAYVRDHDGFAFFRYHPDVNAVSRIGLLSRYEGWFEFVRDSAGWRGVLNPSLAYSGDYASDYIVCALNATLYNVNRRMREEGYVYGHVEKWGVEEKNMTVIVVGTRSPYIIDHLRFGGVGIILDDEPEVDSMECFFKVVSHGIRANNMFCCEEADRIPYNKPCDMRKCVGANPARRTWEEKATLFDPRYWEEKVALFDPRYWESPDWSGFDPADKPAKRPWLPANMMAAILAWGGWTIGKFPSLAEEVHHDEPESANQHDPLECDPYGSGEPMWAWTCDGTDH